MEIRSEYIDLNVGDGTRMKAWTARPVGPDTHPGLLVFQEAFGVNAYIREVTERFAREGYVAVAPELYHRTGPGFEGHYDDLAGALVHLRAIKKESLEEDLRVTYDWLRVTVAKDARVGVVGFCVGGMAAFLAALTLPLACGVSFYGSEIAPNPNGPGLTGRSAELRCPLLFFWGGQDKHITQEQVGAVTHALRAAGTNFVNVEISEADHGFFCDVKASYSPTAAALAWPLTLAFLKTHLSGPRRDLLNLTSA